MNYDEDYIDENSLWLVIKSLRHVSNFKVFLICYYTQNGYKLLKDDVIKLGRVKFKVKEI